MSEVQTVADYFGCNVFSDKVMRDRLPKNIYKSVMNTKKFGIALDDDVANVVANAMKDWAIEKGATHYTHWFQPMTGITAEKHDAFITPTEDGNIILEFSGKELVKGEPDASSFPSGGLRATFEARGYTAWDPTSNAFVKDNTLYIPTAFCSYTGEILDKKTPLLRSMEVVNEQALRILKLFGNTTATRVTTTVGPEQEYFLVDKKYYDQRKDLMLTGRTLFGAMAPKGQELEDHYFGNIKQRVSDFMKDLDCELWKLGIYAKTKHNEVAPAQHELAPVFTTSNIAADHNQLTMEIMKKVALKHGLVCLLHEKPFAGVNGSGKHNNWSIGTNTGVNLLDPGKTPNENKQFLLVLACIMKAVDTHADLLRQSASDVGNDHRLGANEAPPAIISMYLGDQLEDVVNQIVANGTAATCMKGEVLDLGISSIPVVTKDATDRNRTSPFAFTGNKFEFRMVGSNDSIAMPNTTLNAIVAEAFKEAADALEGAADFDKACDEFIAKTMREHQRIVFNGNGYSDEWVAEAEKRGLPNLKSMVAATEALTTDKAVKLFGDFNIMSKAELELRAEVLYETYSLSINIEALTMIDMAAKDILPAVVKYTTELAASINEVTAAGADASVQKEMLDEISKYLKEANEALKKLKADQADAEKADTKSTAEYYRDVIKADMEALRAPVDTLETLVDSEYWPIPTYGDLLFEA
mgnify:CR=1 FL=1